MHFFLSECSRIERESAVVKTLIHRQRRGDYWGRGAKGTGPFGVPLASSTAILGGGLAFCLGRGMNPVVTAMGGLRETEVPPSGDGGHGRDRCVDTALRPRGGRGTRYHTVRRPSRKEEKGISPQEKIHETHVPG